MTGSIATELERLAENKTAIESATAELITAITAKGVTVPSGAKLSDLADKVEDISTTIVEPLSVTENGTYTAPTGKAYSPVTVNVAGGGGSPTAQSKDVNFIDYDGTVRYSYTKSEFAALTALPANPTHDGLTAQGWNWLLSDAQAYVAKYGKLWIGQMYITDDGKTRVYIHLEEGRTSPMLGCCPKGTVDVDWGDGTAHETLTGDSTTSEKWTPTHNYASPGDYIIKLTVTGSMGLYGASSVYQRSGLLRYSSDADTRNYAYHNAIRGVEIGSGVTRIGNYAFNNCYNLTSVTIPDGVTSIGTSAFDGCYNLTSVTIPDGVTRIGDYAFRYCCNLTSVTIPDSVTSIDVYAFNTCYGLAIMRFLPQTPPTVSNATAFSSIPADCVIHVPHGTLSAYTTATNYPDPTTYTYVEDSE